MIALLPTLLLATGAANADAARPAPIVFDHDGKTYRAVDFHRGENRIVRGRSSDGTRFRFVVRGHQVTGQVDGTPVEFSLDASQ